MIGRFLGSILLTDKSVYRKIAGIISVLLLSLLLITYVHSLHTSVYYTLAIVFASIILFKLSKPHSSLTLFSLINVLLLLVVLTMSGTVVIWAVVLVGLFNSIMWSNIFTLSIHGLGVHTSRVLFLLVMAIVGGAVLPVIIGYLADQFNIQTSFIVPLFGFIYLILFGLKSMQLVKL